MARSTARAIRSRPLDLLILCFLLAHIPITFLFDSQIVLPREWVRAAFPGVLQRTLANYVRASNDPLVRESPVWFAALTLCEFAVQLPLGFVLARGLVANTRLVKTVGLVYGSHTASCLVPILSELIVATNPIQTPAQQLLTVAIYSVWFLVPLAILVAMLFRTVPAPVKTRKPLPLLSRPGDMAMLSFFVMHIPITLFFATQFLFPEYTKTIFPDWIQEGPRKHIRDTNDYLVQEREIWFLSTLWCEILFQLPMYIYLVTSLVADSRHVRTAGIVYAAHTCTMLVPILADMGLTSHGAQTTEQRRTTMGLYSMWFAIPLCILGAMLMRVEVEQGAGAVKEKGEKAKTQ